MPTTWYVLRKETSGRPRLTLHRSLWVPGFTVRACQRSRCFQALVNDVLRGLLNIFVFVYWTTFLFSHLLSSVHVQHVRRVLQVTENRRLSGRDVHVHAQSVTFLGSVVSAEGISMDPDKVRAVIDWPVPDSRVALQRFLGFANFYRRLSGILVVLPLRLPLSPLLRLAFLGPGLLRMRSSGLRGCLPPLPSSSLLIPRGSL